MADTYSSYAIHNILFIIPVFLLTILSIYVLDKDDLARMEKLNSDN